MIIALNNKSNLNKEEFLAYQEQLNNLSFKSQLIVCPTALNVNLYNMPKIDLGSQNVSKTKSGAYTGEISAEMLKASGVKYCIVGHSERREYQKESLEDINQKLKMLSQNNIIPILCVGETKEERQAGKTNEIITKELLSAVEGLNDSEKSQIIVAYEPIWSIGTGIIPTNEEIRDTFLVIKQIMKTNKILYGGSANEENIDTLKVLEIIDGYLLGGLSLKPNELQIFINKLENK